MLQKIPKPLLVFLVLLVGVGLFFVVEKPHSVCDSQYEVFKEVQKGHLYSYTEKKVPRRATYPRFVEACKLGNSAGACFEFFRFLRRFAKDMEAAPAECLTAFGEKKEIERVVKEGTQLMVRMAWGEAPPEPAKRFGWFESVDLSTFCSLRSLFLRMYGEPELEAFMMSTAKKLPGEVAFFDKGSCLNCDSRKMASEIFGREEIWRRSLFSVRCDSFR